MKQGSVHRASKKSLVDRFLKFLAKLEPRLRERVLHVSTLIEAGRWEGMNIRPLRGYKNQFRCRIGDIRLIFTRTESGHYQVIKADFRGNIYKK